MLLDLIRVTLLFFSLGKVAVDLLSFWSSFFPVSLIVSSSSSTNPRGEGTRPSAVHDELVFDVHESEIDLMKSLVKKEMESAVELNVPLDVEIEIGDNWLDAH